MNRPFASSASHLLSLSRTPSLTVFVAAATIGGLPFASPVVGTSSWTNLGVQSAVAQSSNVDAARAAARTAMANSQWKVAVDRWTEVLAANPSDEEALKGLAAAKAALDQGSTNNQVVEDLTIRRERAVVMFKADLEQADGYLKQANYAAAERVLLTAKVRLEKDKGILPPSEFAGMTADVDKRLDQVQDARTQAALAAQDQQRKEAQVAASNQQKAEMEQRQRSINESLLRVRQLQLELKYEEALQVLDEILFIDPHNPAALALKDTISTTLLYRKVSEVEAAKELAFGNEVLGIRSSLRPPRPNLSGEGPKSVSGLVEYPEDWPQLSIRRDGAAGYRESDANRQAMMDLNKVVSVNFNNNQFDQVLNYMKQVSGVEFFPDWKALEAIGVRAEDTVTLTLNDVPAQVALRRVLEQFGEDTDRPQYSIEDGVVVVSSDDALRKKTLTIVYDIRDLLFEVPYFDNAPDFNLNSAIQQAGRGQGGQGGGGTGGGGGGFGGGGGGGFGGGGGGGGGSGGGGQIFGDPGDDPERKSREELIEQIKNIIQEQIEPETGWRDLGGEPGTIQELNGNLIITQTPRNHREIEGLLSQLRTIRALQINIESRLINVSLEWFEQIGIDLDIYFNTNNQMYDAARAADPNFNLSDFFYRNQPTTSAFKNGDLKNPVIFDSLAQSNDFANSIATGSQFGQPDPGDPTAIQYVTGPVGAPIRRQQGWTPIGVTQNSLQLTETLAAAGLGPVGLAGMAAPALNVGISYLDDVQVDLLIKATQADQRNVVLTSPRLTLFNGQRSWISVAKAISFISGLTPVTGDSSGAFQPQVSVIYEGFVLDVEAVISADRRYVTMTVQFGLNQNVKFKDVKFTGAAGASDVVGRGSSTFEGTFQLPELEGSQVATTVSVPDKGTILLGGQRKLNEFEVESGVPVLSKIPIINRFFTNRVTNRTELTSLLLIRPEVIIQQENEMILFPGLSDQIGSGAIGN